MWDGISIDGLEGNTGRYLMYNNPHKLSLYIVSGLSVVISKEAAEAEFVIKNNVGIVVDKISDFEEKYKLISDDDYDEMLECVKKCAEKINSGYYLKKAVGEIEHLMNSVD